MFATDFRDRVLSFDDAAARALAQVASSRQRAGRPISQLDAQIAAITASRDAAVATRHDADFAGCGIDVINSWKKWSG